MRARQIFQYALLVTAVSRISQSTATAQTVRSEDVYTVGDKGDRIVIVERFTTADGSLLAVHNLKLFRDGKADSVVFKVFRGAAEITNEVASIPGYQVKLRDGQSLVFISGAYVEGGKTQRVTRVLPTTDTALVRPGPSGGLLVEDRFNDADSRTVSVTKAYAIGRNSELLDTVQSVRRGEIDLTPSILSGQCKSIPIRDGTLQFQLTPSPNGPPSITVSTR